MALGVRGLTVLVLIDAGDRGAWRRPSALLLSALVLLTACRPEGDAPAPPLGVATSQPALLQAGPHGDGDSWRDTAGREYRLGMIDTPEVGDCFAAQATAERRRLVAAGFRADVYTTDRYGRQVSVVHAADGTNVNVHLARHGFADDRYLQQFRHEHPDLAAQLDAAFAAAKREQAGLWGSCR